MTKTIAVFVFLAVLTGCSGPIPNKVSPDEYEVYSEWTKTYVTKRASSSLYIRNRTFAFDPFGTPFQCGKTLHDAEGVPRSFMKQLHALGDAEYPLDLDSADTRLRVPWKYKPVDEWQEVSEAPGEYNVIAFSRVAFNRGHTKALFAIDHVCGGLCGGGGAVYAQKENGAWLFGGGESCIWLY
jgi:hypothetical protein